MKHLIAIAGLLLLSLGIGSPSFAETEKLENSLGMRLVRIPAGEFEMGMLDEHQLKLTHKQSAYQREIHDYIEKPSFPVSISSGYAIGSTEVTVGQFRQFIEETDYQTDAEKAGAASVLNTDLDTELDRFSPKEGHNWKSPGFPQSDDHPVTCISWNDAMAFCEWLSNKESVTYRLPTEAEWEYACRAGTKTPYCCGVDPDCVYSFGNVADAALYAKFPEDVLRQRTVALREEDGDGFAFTAPVGSLKPNDWNIFDMHGNVWEWCSDRYSDRIYQKMLELARERGSRTAPEPIVDPQGPESTPQHQHGDWRSLRGGSWYVAPMQCRSSVRAFAEASDAFSYIGFRIVRETGE